MSESTSAVLSRFSRVNAVALPLACAVALLVGAAWPLVVAGVALELVLIAACRGRHTPRGSFGLGNAVTFARLLLASSVGLVPDSVPLFVLGGVVLVVFALDGLDGLVAARRGEKSEFGAHFDMEVDAYFVLLLGLELFQRGRYGAWILGPGLLRYAYVLCLALLPAKRGHQPRWAHGRHAFTALMLGFTLGMVLCDPFGTVATALGCGLVTASFVYSFYWSYAA